jgi:Fibronectin type III domain/Divergent InlB B-repeat domain
MARAPTIVAAALTASAAAVVVALLATGAGSATKARVELQLAPRGGGQVSAQPPGRNSDGALVTTPCDDNQGQDDCRWFYDSGTTVTLTAKPSGAGSSFSGWSTPDCGGTGPCTVKLDADLTTVVAVFNPLLLGVKLSNSDAATVTTDPPGQKCQRDLNDNGECFAFPPHTRVRVTVKTKDGHKFREWNPGCEPRDQPTCTVIVEDEPTWVGARFDDDDRPNLATTISVQFRLTKSGNGSGHVSASKLDCGNSCAARYDYGQSVSLTAKPDAGSTFDGWNGVCARTQATCTFPVGPITAIRVTFARDNAAPSAPGNLAASTRTRTSIAVAWGASTDNVGVAGYRVYLDDKAAGDTTATQYTLDGLMCGHSYAIAVDAADAVGNRSQRATLSAETAPCALAARVAGLSVTRAGTLRRVVVRLRVNRATTARLRLLAHGKVVASGRYAVRPGTNVLRLGVPSRLPGGSYRLAVALVNPDGGTLSLPTRGALLPRPR